jgi:CubicO group peptidase (beta-lactamase class C family)
MLRRCLLATAVLLAFSFVGTAAPPTISEAGRAALSEFLQSSVSHADAPAVVALVASPDRVLFEDAAGKRSVAGNVAVTPDTIFRIASMTKPVTSLAVMMLVDEGKVGLDDPVTSRLPGCSFYRITTMRRCEWSADSSESFTNTFTDPVPDRSLTGHAGRAAGGPHRLRRMNTPSSVRSNNSARVSASSTV